MLKNVAVVVLDDFSPFELGVVCEVFGSDRSDDGLPVYDFAVVAGEPGPLRSDMGFTMQTSFGLERIKQADLIAVPAMCDDVARCATASTAARGCSACAPGPSYSAPQGCSMAGGAPRTGGMPRS